MAQSSFLEKDSPVDFLYLDRQRVASLAGQLSDHGMLVGLKSTAQKTQGKEGNATGNLGVAKAEGKIIGSHSESSEETYDPFWAHAFSFLQDLESNFAVPLETARMGSLVKFQGLIQFVDLKMMRNLWEPVARASLSPTPVIGQTPAVPSRKKRREQHQTRDQKMPDAMKFGLDILKEAPHLLNLTFLSDSGFRFWAAAQPDYLTISSEALTMKFGAAIDGVWTVVGIVDGKYGEPSATWSINPVLDAVVSAMNGFREVIGRPKNYWGLTPIAIYAPLRGAVEEAVEQSMDVSPDPPGPA